MAIIIMPYGATTSRKTTALGKAAEYMYRKTGLPGRAIYSDLGNWQTIKPIVDAGLVEPFNISGEPQFLMLLHKLARGEWPTALVGGLAQERHPVVAGSPYPIGVAKMAPTPNIGSKISFYFWEGLTSSSELLMKYLRDYRIDIKAKEPLSPFQAKDQDSGLDMKFCANSMAHYGYTQDEIITSILPVFAALPVERLFITAHEAAGNDEDNAAIRGPALVGSKGTGRMGKNVGDMFHFEIYTKPGAKPGDPLTTDVRCYFKSHPDPKFPNIFYHCKTRLPETQVAALEKAFPGGYFSPNDFDRFLEVYDGLLAVGTDAMIEWKKKVDTERAERAAKEAVKV